MALPVSPEKGSGVFYALKDHPSCLKPFNGINVTFGFQLKTKSDIFQLPKDLRKLRVKEALRGLSRPPKKFRLYSGYNW